MEKIKQVLIKLKEWSFNYEDDISFMNRMEREHG